MAKEPLVCDFAKARIGCRMIADHILELAQASHAVLESISKGKSSKGVLRSAYILNLIAYEEAGKLFMMWQALAEAENEHLGKVRIEEFEYHEPKGDLAGDLCCQMLDFAEGELEGMMAIVKTIDPLLLQMPGDQMIQALSVLKSTLSTHKERVYRIRRHFKQEREDAMYIDSREDDWVPQPHLSQEMLAMDCILLNVIARAANAFLAEGPEFGLAVKAISDLSRHLKTDESDRFMTILQKHDPMWFGLLKESPPKNGLSP